MCLFLLYSLLKIHLNKFSEVTKYINKAKNVQGLEDIQYSIKMKIF